MDLAAENAYPTPYANTPILPLLLLSLMRQKNSPTPSDIFRREEYDFIIVGAGSAGSVLANRLSEIPCVNVLLLEAGKPPPLLTDVPVLSQDFAMSDVSWDYLSVPQKHTARALINNQVPFPCGKTLGGSSVLNTMYYVRGNRRNYDQWAEQGAVGWSYSDVLPYFYKAENNTSPEYIADGYHVVGGLLTVSKQRYRSPVKFPVFEAAQQLGYKKVDINARTQTGFYDAETTIRDGQRCSTAKAYLVPAENRTNLDILAKAFVRKVVIQDGRAVGVLFDYEGASYQVRAKREVIMSAGALNSPQLLMLSGIGPREQLEQFNIPVFADLPVGKNFQDHCGSYIFFELDPHIPNLNRKLKNPATVQEYIQRRRGPLSSSLSNPLAFLSSPFNFEYDFPDYQLYFGESSAPEPNPNYGVLPEVLEKYFGPYKNSSLYHCLSQMLLPKSRGTVQLRSSNPYDPPLIDPNYFEHPDDIRSVVEGLKTCQKIGTSEPLRKIGSKPLSVPFPGCEMYYGNEDSYFECLVRANIISIHHPVGTCKMGNPYDPTTVVDTNLRVKGIDGLRVVDASIMPIIPSGNTNNPTIMIAEKASDLIKSTLNCYTQTPV